VLLEPPEGGERSGHLASEDGNGATR